MGKYFVMSRRFDKRSAADFGLLPTGEPTAQDPADGSTWVMAELYDFGWGREHGFYRLPLPDYDALLELALHGGETDDAYGAAAVILERYPDELLQSCEALAGDPLAREELQTLARLFALEVPINRSPTVHKSTEQVSRDHARWQRLAETVRQNKR